jgi:cyclopropane fatty-acyl-phospholipid synthase-like methyltransferase
MPSILLKMAMDMGIDATPLAIEKAREKAVARGISVRFLILDALSMAGLGRRFDTVTDSGFFHTLSDGDRRVFLRNLAEILPSGGNYFMLCFSDKEPAGYGPRRIAESEIRETFRNGWTIRYIRPATFESNTRAEGSRAWLSSITKT